MIHKSKKRYQYTEKELSIINDFVSAIWEMGYLHKRDMSAVDSFLCYIENDSSRLAEMLDMNERDVLSMSEKQVLNKIYNKYIDGN